MNEASSIAPPLCLDSPSRSNCVELDDAITCMMSLRDYVVFSVRHVLFIWPLNCEQPNEPIELNFFPTTMSSSENRLFMASSEAALLGEVQGIASDAQFFTDSVMFPPHNTELFPLIAHSVFSHDGGLVSVCCQSDVFVVAASSADFNVPAVDDDDCPTPRSSFVRVECSKYFGSSSAVLTIFSAAGNSLFVVSKSNHLICIGLPETLSECFLDCGSVLSGTQLVRDGGILSPAHSITSLCVDAANGNLLVGLASGVVTVLNDRTLVPLFSIDCASLSRRFRQVADDGSDTGEPDPDLTNNEQPILEVHLHSTGSFLVVTPVAVLFMSRSTLTPLQSDQTPVEFFSTVYGSISASSGHVLLWSTFQRRCVLAQLSKATPSTAMLDESDIVHANTALAPAFLLGASLKKDVLAQTNGPARKPVTFGRPIKSSGYSSSEPWSVTQARKQNQKNASKAARPLPTSSKSYDSTVAFPSLPCDKTNSILVASKVHQAVVLSMSFDATGQYLFSGSGDKTIHSLKLPVLKHQGAGANAKGHTSLVTTIDTSLALHHPLVASGSADGHVALWKPSKRETPYVFENVGKEVRTVRFGYMDKMLAYSSGSSVHLSQFAVDEGGGELDRKRNLSSLRRVYTISTTSQQVNDIDWINSFLSTILLWGGSNKQIGVHDIAAERDIRVVEDAHGRPIHSLVMMRHSRFCQLSAETLHLFVTASTDKTVRLWDMRQSECVRQFSSHINSSMKVGLTTSPCGRFIVAGSEDNSAVVYSLHDGQVLAKLPTRDTVTSLAFHPLESGLLVAGCANGDLKFFSAATR